MRLLDVSNLQIQSGFDDGMAGLTEEAKVQRELWDLTSSESSYEIPPYAILSHRWVGCEVVFNDFDTVPKERLQSVAEANPVPKTTGAVENVGDGNEASVYKIAGACEKVRQDTVGISHIWIDTVCINKGDSRELSSALNSMFKWYHNAVVCYVYLYDVTWNEVDDLSGSRQQFRQSKWFTRGWTLQELLAPKKIEFYDRDWRYIGSKQTLMDQIEQATGIAEEHLQNFRTASIAQKMSWLSRRVTSIIEDRAYCMLGLFNVYLETRYGQGGEKEFLRLQREIFISKRPGDIFDESMFAWQTDKIEASGLLAPAPRCFENSSHVLFVPHLAKSRNIPTQIEDGMVIDPAMGIDFHIPWSARKKRWQGAAAAGHLLTFGTYTAGRLLINKAVRDSKSDHLVNLNCWVQGPDQKLRNVRIKVVQDKNDKTWRRIECNSLFESDSDDLFSQADVHGSQSGGRAYFPHRIMYQGSSEWTQPTAFQGFAVKESTKNRHGGISPSAQAAHQQQQNNMAQQQAQMQMQMQQDHQVQMQMHHAHQQAHMQHMMR